jgi:hypothetical protein
MVVGVVVLGGSGKEKGDGWAVRGVQREAKPTIYKEEEAVWRGDISSRRPAVARQGGRGGRSQVR